ncbi:thermonuclease family protein [Candidatus Thiothrix sp. Deng01]|uniref:Thermonuclease family protein n=1 Tax=Candidatus Thiothrix phosphatis TaxID=3112415 RepID=A0ABU6CTM3_9GAMM|nr:thermonuclease family protein [Candidatus Thiothrix sp. Deng01]MEB4590158.1 thermonuclease family protein [Candidatus Thiothrix sp. Deng01]
MKKCSSYMLALLAFSLSACLNHSSLKPDGKLQAQLPPGTKMTDEGHLLANGRVVNISDGDTLTVLGADNQRYKIRLQGIDAPEKSQPYGQKCKEALMMATTNLPVAVEAYKLDKYGRVVAKIIANGKDVALEQLNNGCAWHYTAYAKEQSAADQQTYAAAEQQARKARKGLWREKQPVAPWDYRRQQR